MRVALITAVVALALVAAGCSEHTPREPGAGDGKSLDFTSVTTLTVDANGINPSTLNVEVGDTITIVNGNTVPDGITSGKVASIDTGTLQPGESATAHFTRAETIDISSRTDRSHTGTIVVAAKPES
jgi:plastocyanin